MRLGRDRDGRCPGNGYAMPGRALQQRPGRLTFARLHGAGAITIETLLLWLGCRPALLGAALEAVFGVFVSGWDDGLDVDAVC